ncbi:MAG: OmpA family protein [Bacteroidaceae bacterium]|nr:OmpA family protein [Bacteroidaceae bacterium]
MKKLSTALMLLALFVAPMTMAATTEPETVQDESQGYLLNGFWDNWYISLDGGISLFFSPEDAQDGIFGNFTDRMAPNVALNFGKWWTPVFGTRIGLDYMAANSSTSLADAFGYQNATSYNNLFVQKHQGLRPHIDGMVDLVNLFGGYSKTRIYSLVIYGGFGYGYGWAADQPISTGRWDTEIRGGLINSFHVSKAIDVNVELKVSKYDSSLSQEPTDDFTNLMASANIGIAYKFNERGWEAPVIPVVVPVIPKYSDAEGDALVSRLQEANNRIKELEGNLATTNETLAQTMSASYADEAPAFTIYFDINQSAINACNKKVVRAMANAIKADPNTRYVVTGYADKETGTDAFNAKLREARAKSVYNALVKYGVNPDQLSTATDTNPLNKFNYVLDRAATIKIAR